MLPTLLLTALSSAHGFFVTHGAMRRPLSRLAAVAMSDLSFMCVHAWHAAHFSQDVQSSIPFARMSILTI